MTAFVIPALTDFFDALEEGVLFLDRKRQVVSMNQAAAEMTGSNREHLSGSLCPSLFKDSPCARACSERGKCSLTAAPNRDRKVLNLSFKREDGSSVYLHMWAMLLPEDSGLPFCAIILRDRTREMQLEEEVSERLRLGGMAGHAPAMRRLFNNILRAALSDATVLITGESGTGKELAARALHENSNRREGPYVRIHCAAFPENLLESELFGYVAGAFTGAAADRVGRFEAADGGSILLDEIGEISPAIQTKLLRVIQEREVERLGENKPRKVDVRIITATNRDLAAMVEEGSFREDLFYRLRVLPIQVPALRDRKEDVPLLAGKLLGEMAQRYERPNAHLSEEALRVMGGYSWPGNVRELGNALEYALVHSDGDLLGPESLPPEIVEKADPFPRPVTGAPAPEAVLKMRQPISRYYQGEEGEEEKARIEAALEQAGGNRSQAARTLGMSRTTLWKRLKQYGLF